MDSYVAVLDDAFANQKLPRHQKIIDLLTEQTTGDAPNLLLYGAEGFPLEYLWRAAAKKAFGPFDSKECIWENSWHYIDAGYFFEIDMMNPHQPKQAHSICDFLKEIITHTSHQSERHIILLRNIEILCQKGEFSMRVILERFWKNVWFLCTTHHIGNIEAPIRSRFCHVRVPMTSMEELKSIYGSSLSTELEQPTFIFAHYISRMQSLSSPIPVETLCQFRVPLLADFLSKKQPTIDQIRSCVQQLTVHSISIRDISLDLLIHVCPPKKKTAFIEFAANVEHMCSCTEGYRRSLYLEWLLHAAIYGFYV